MGWIDLVLDSEFLNQIIKHWNQFLSVLQLPTAPGISIFHAWKACCKGTQLKITVAIAMGGERKNIEEANTKVERAIILSLHSFTQCDLLEMEAKN